MFDCSSPRPPPTQPGLYDGMHEPTPTLRPVNPRARWRPKRPLQVGSGGALRRETHTHTQNVLRQHSPVGPTTAPARIVGPSRPYFQGIHDGRAYASDPSAVGAACAALIDCLMATTRLRIAHTHTHTHGQVCSERLNAFRKQLVSNHLGCSHTARRTLSRHGNRASHVPSHPFSSTGYA